MRGTLHDDSVAFRSGKGIAVATIVASEVCCVALHGDEATPIRYATELPDKEPLTDKNCRVVQLRNVCPAGPHTELDKIIFFTASTVSANVGNAQILCQLATGESPAVETLSNEMFHRLIATHRLGNSFLGNSTDGTGHCLLSSTLFCTIAASFSSRACEIQSV